MPLPKIPFPNLRPRRREVVLLPDQRFFVRSVELASGEGVPDPVEQIELGLELRAPFPVSQLYYGYWITAARDRALVFAAYRKRFTEEETESWPTAAWVAPRFAALLAGAAPAPATAWVLVAADAVTVVHFADGSGVPTFVGATELSEDASEAQIREARDALIKRAGDSRSVEEFGEIEIEAGNPGDEDLEFRSGDRRVELPIEQAELLDVRETSELAARRRARVRDQWLWRTAVAAVVVVGLSLVTEAALFGVGFWQRGREQLVARQVPVVREIEVADQLVNRIEELSTRRLRPFEMLALVDGPRPEAIVFLRTLTQGTYTLVIEAYSPTQEGIYEYVSALEALPGVESVSMQDMNQNAGRADFRFSVEFNALAFQTASVEGGGAS